MDDGKIDIYQEYRRQEGRLSP
ncbi:MAG: hypothetical protein JG781_2166, partial [Peptococcaceae bacterium]|nr:hypothetical protein [Peptococcaceae bacterium]